MNRRRSTTLVVLLIVLLLVLSACATNHKSFDDLPGNIYAGTEAEVLENWHSTVHSTKHGRMMTELFVWTRRADCTGNCSAFKHKVKPGLFRQLEIGEEIWWEGDGFAAIVTDLRYSTGRKRHETGYKFGLKVRQCIQVCVVDFVQVGFQTWYDFDPGDKITFGGDKGEVVS